MAYWFGQSNLLDGLDATTLAASSVKGGSVGFPIKTGTGSAVAYTAGSYEGLFTVTYCVQIDDVSGGASVGEATFRWKRSDSTATWEAEGVATSDTYIELDRGVEIKWVAGEGDDFIVGDNWVIIAAASFGLANLSDLNRDSAWRSDGLDSPDYITADLGGAYEALLVQALLESSLTLKTGQGALTLVRASQASYVDPDTGLIDLASANEPRFEEINGRKALLLEPAATNTFLCSDIDSTCQWYDAGGGNWILLDAAVNTYWFASISGGAAATPSLTSSIIRAATGARAVRISVTAQGGASTDIVYGNDTGLNPQSVVNGNTYTVSFYAKADTAKTIPVDMWEVTGYTSVGLNTSINVTTELQRFDLTFTANQTASNCALLFFLGLNGTFALDLECPQNESGALATSWIPTTTAAATRATEEGQPCIAASGNFSDDAGVLYLDWTPRFDAADAPNDKTIGIATVSGSAAGVLYWRKDAGGSCYLCMDDGTNTHSTSLSPVKDTTYIVYARWWGSASEKPGDGTGDADMHVGFYNGAAWSHGSETPYDGAFGVAADIELFKSGATCFACYVGNLRIYDETLTRAQIEAGPENLDSAASPTAIVILDHNFGSGAAINLKYGNEDSEAAWAAASSHSLAWASGTMAKLDLTGSARYWRLEVTDPDNPDGYLEISELFVGTGLIPTAIITGDENVTRGYDLSSVDHDPKNDFSFTFLADSLAVEEEISTFLMGLLDPASRRIRPFFFCYGNESPSANTFLLKISTDKISRVQAGRDHYYIPIQATEAERSGV